MSSSSRNTRISISFDSRRRKQSITSTTLRPKAK